MPAKAGQKESVSYGIISQDSDNVKIKFSDRSSYTPTFYSLFEKRIYQPSQKL
jgi:hypothetical protein